MINCLEDVDVDVLEDVDDGNVLEDTDNVDVGVRCNFYVCRRRRCRERKPRQSVKFVRSFVVRRVVLESLSSSAKPNTSASPSTPPRQRRNTSTGTHLNQPCLLPSLSPNLAKAP